MRALVVEDYAPLRGALREGLEENGFAVDAAADGREALWMAQSNPYDIVVLDLMLPQLDGATLLREMRAKGATAAVIVLTARDAVEERVKLLDMGADDYLVKPFAFAELLARVRALVRRKYGAADPVVVIADLEVDTARRVVRRAGTPVALSAREYVLLEYLARRAGELVTRTDIWEHVYDFRSEATSNVVDVYIGYLRKKLERDGAPKLIHTRRGQGYVLGLDDA